MKIRTFFYLLFLVIETTALGQVVSPVVSDNRAEKVYLSMPEPPLGYFVTKQPFVADAKPQGFRVIVAKESPGTAVVIAVETSFDRSKKPARIAAYKGCVHGIITELQAKRYKMGSSNLPDPQKANYNVPIKAYAEFENAGGEKMFVQIYIFFTDIGYQIQIVGFDKGSVEAMSQWAQKIKPVVPCPSRKLNP